MISKVVRGKTFYGACRYVCGNEKRAVILEAEGVREYNYREMARDFEVQHNLRPSLGKPVFHGILSFYPGEKPEDETMIQIARDYLKHIGIKDTQYVVTKHTDKDHLHLHILANMVNNKGETIKDNFIGLRGKKAAELITIGYKLIEAKGKDLSKTNIESLNEREAIRYKIYGIISEQLPKCRTMEELITTLQKKGVETTYKYNAGTSERQGVSFSMNEYKFKGSEVDRNYSLANLAKALVRRQNLIPIVAVNTPVDGKRRYSTKNETRKIKKLDWELSRTSFLKELFHSETSPEVQPPSLLPKKRKKKKKGRNL